MAEAATGYSTIGTYLKIGSTVANLTKVCPIKSYPDLGGAPERIEITTLENNRQVYVMGVQAGDEMEFTCNYTPENYAAALAAVPAEGTENYYQVEFGTNGAQGKFRWKGTHSCRVTGGEVNAAREMVIACVASTDVDMITNESGTS